MLDCSRQTKNNRTHPATTYRQTRRRSRLTLTVPSSDTIERRGRPRHRMGVFTVRYKRIHIIYFFFSTPSSPSSFFTWKRKKVMSPDMKKSENEGRGGAKGMRAQSKKNIEKKKIGVVSRYECEIGTLIKKF